MSEIKNSEKSVVETGTKIEKPIPSGNALVYGISRFFVKTYLRLGGGQAFGQDNIPLKGRFILAANHVSHLDPPLLSSYSPRCPHVIAKKELFENPVLAWYFRGLGAFPVDRGKADRKAIRHSIKLLESGAPLMIFPEGTRSLDGTLGKAEIGLGMIAHATQSPIIPVYLQGTEQAASAMNPKFRIVKIHLHYGKPIDLREEYSTRGGREVIEAIGEKTMQAIADLRDTASQRTAKP